MVQRKKTRKTNAARKAPVLTIPELKMAFDYIELFAKSSPSVEDFQREWKRVFHRPIYKEHAESYLKFVEEAEQHRRPVLRKYRGRGGGEGPGVFAGQGLVADAVTESGLRPYGIFQKYVADGFDIGIPQMSSQIACQQGLQGPQGPLPSAPMDGGRRRGSKRTLRKIRGGRFPESMNPTSLLQDIAIAWRGEQLPASPSALDNPYLVAAAAAPSSK